ERSSTPARTRTERAMAITQQELGRRLRLAREACSFTQDHVGERVGLSRSAIAQIELGNRAVTSLELDQFARLYGRDIRDFLAPEFAEDNALLALFRANEDIANRDQTAEALRHCLSIGREFTNLERLIGLDRDLTSLIRYAYPLPRSRFDAIKQGTAIAEQERRRLGLGDGPIEDIVDLLEQQGIRTALVDLPDDVSGLTLTDRDAGPFVVANRSEHLLRRTFSFAHEFAHVLLDVDSTGIISRAGDRAELMEVRANAFAANFLMPEAGGRQFLSALGKAGEAKLLAETPTTEDDAMAIEARGDRTESEIAFHDVVLLAHHFGVSRSVALYRLRNLQLLSERELKDFLQQEQGGRGRDLARFLDLPQPDHASERNKFRHRFLNLAIEAFTRDIISRSKLEELFAAILERPRSEIPFETLDDIIAERPTGVSVPAV
ncbi:MAG: ImmA/IrrE family metallo-endopeptidase, partial [Alphaproteobacteria bacterium]|nr:ImmA/IrrE family metallo-endopeptidase [Alphaproteobacteria bacterium]